MKQKEKCSKTEDRRISVTLMMLPENLEVSDLFSNAMREAENAAWTTGLAQMNHSIRAGKLGREIRRRGLVKEYKQHIKNPEK